MKSFKPFCSGIFLNVNILFFKCADRFVIFFLFKILVMWLVIDNSLAFEELDDRKFLEEYTINNSIPAAEGSTSKVLFGKQVTSHQI